jgi:hypothetical protein
MKLLPNRHVNCAPPIAPSFRAYGEIIPSGESAAHWIWTWPRLLGFEHTINWLFPHVFDPPRKACWNLWGIDSVGSVLIAETNVDQQQTLRDPFRNLLSASKTLFNNQTADTGELHQQWRRFMTEQDGRLGFPPAATSNFGSLMGQSAYERAVERALAQRETAGNPPPVLVPVVSSHQVDFCLSAEAEKNWLFLQRVAGSTRVLPRGIKATLGVKGLRIHCWSPQSTALSSRSWRPARGILMH